MKMGGHPNRSPYCLKLAVFGAGIARTTRRAACVAGARAGPGVIDDRDPEQITITADFSEALGAADDLQDLGSERLKDVLRQGAAGEQFRRSGLLGRERRLDAR